MADLDINAYLNTKLADIDIGKKMDELSGTSLGKSERLEATIAKHKVRQNTWAGGIGFADGSLEADAVNLGASAVYGLGRAAGHVASLIPNQVAIGMEANTPDAVMEAYNRFNQNQATPADIALLKSKDTRNADALNAPTVMERLQTIENTRGVGRQINNMFDFKTIVDQGNRDGLTESLNAAQPDLSILTDSNAPITERAKALAGVLGTAASSAYDNPMAAAEYVAENLPQLMVGGMGAKGATALAGSNIGYATDAYSRGMERLAAEGKAIPLADERQAQLLRAGSLAAAEQVGDLVMLGAGKIGTRLADDAVTAGFKQSLLRTAKAGAVGMLNEAGTEGFQTYQEGVVENKPASAMDIYQGAVIGGLAGGGLTTGGRAMAEVLKATPEHEQVRQQETNRKATEAATFQAAVDSGSPDVYLDRKAPTYNPAKAVGVLMALAEKEDTTPEQFDEHLAKATEVVDKLHIQRANADPKAVEAKIAAAQEELKATDPTDTEEVTYLTEHIASLTERLTDLNDSKNAVRVQNQLKVVENQLKEAEATYAGFTRLATPAPSTTEVADNLTQADSTDVKVSTKAAQTLINLSMTAPSNVDPDAALKLAENKANGLTDDQRTALRQFSEARLAENALKDLGKVSKEILYGSTNYVGLSQYRDRIAQAITAKSESRAASQLALLESFVEDHTKKLAIAETAPVPSQIIKVGKDWQINTGKRLSDAKLKENGGFNLHHNSTKLVDAFRKEVTAATLTHAQLSDAVATRFGKPVAPSEPVSVESPQPAATDTPVSPASLFREMREREGRVDLGEPKSTQKPPETNQSVEEKPQAVVSKQRTPGSPENDSVITVSAGLPSPTPAASVADASSLQDGSATPATSPEATKQPAAVSEANPAPAAEVATEEEITQPTQTGKLSVLAGFVKDAAPVADLFKDKLFNPVAQFLDQKDTNEDYKSHRPLVKVPNFLSSIKDSSSFVGFLKDALTPEQLKALSHFRKVAKRWNPLVLGNIGLPDTKESSFEFRFNDLMQYMVSREGDTVVADENLLTAISYGAYHWAVDTASAPKITKEQINAMHGRDEDSDVQSGIWKSLSGTAGFEDVVMNDIGAMIVQSLGLTVRANAPQDILPRLKTALGAHAFLLLEKEQLLERKDFLLSEIVQYLAPKKDEVIRENARPIYVFPNYEALASFKEINKGTSNIVDKLFAAEPGTKWATTTPIPFKQAFAQHTQQEIAPAQRKAMEALHKTPHTMIPDMFNVLKGIGKDNLLTIAGVRDLETVHVTNQKSVEAQNDNLTNQYNLMMEMMGIADPSEEVDNKLEQQFYVQGEVWKNFRAGITTRSLNQQTSKIHRYMFGRPNWTVTVDFAQENQVNDLKIAIAAGLGMKTDNQPNAQTLEQFEAKVADPALRILIDDIRIGLTDGVWTQGDAIAAYASAAEGMMTLQALVTLAKYENALEAGESKVEVTMLVGADGKTNGPILTHLALGAADDVNSLLTMMERGGMYQAGDGQPEHYSQWRANGKQDLYEDLAEKLLKYIRTSPEMDALQVITGSLRKGNSVSSAGRKLVKTPLTAFAFGSSLEGSIRAMEDKFIASIYDQIEQLSTPEQSKALIQAVNTLVRMSNPRNVPTPEGISIAELMGMTLPEEDEQALRKSFQTLMAEPVKTTMESYFAVFMQRRTHLNNTVQAAYAMYNTAYAAARQAKLESLMDSGELAFRTGRTGKMKGKRIALHDLTTEQENELRKNLAHLLPVANTAYTVQDNNLAAGIYMAKSDAGLSDEAVHVTKVSTVNPVYRGTGIDGKPQYANSIQTRSMVRTEADPGVAGTPYFIHSLDSANMHMALLEATESLNVHDEIGNSPLDITKAAAAINGATVKNLLAFSPAREALHMLERIAIGFGQQVEAGTVSKEQVGQLLSGWQDTIKSAYKMKSRPDAHTAARMMFGLALDNAHAADELRLGTIAQLGAVDQYVWENGQFEVPESLRAEAQAQLDSLKKKMDPAAAQAMATIIKFYQAPAETKTAPKEEADPLPQANAPVGGAALANAMEQSITQEAVNAMDPVERAQTIQKIAQTQDKLSGTGMTPWGQLGTPTMVQDAVRDAFAATPTMTKQQVVSLLSKTLSGGYRTILSQVARGLPENLKVVLVTPQTDPAAILDMPHENSRGWYVANTAGENVIYVLSDAFVHSGLNSETLLHELIHGALAREVQNPTSKAAEALVTELTGLMDHVKTQPGADKFVQATGDIQEFLAWGLSNKPFQSFLNKIEYNAGKTKSNKLVSAMKEFIRIISRGIWDQSALYAVLQNTAGLFEQAANNSKPANINLSQVATPTSYTTEQIYDGLASTVHPLKEQDDARLRALMLTMVEKLAPLYGVFGKDVQTSTLSAASVFAAVQKGGQAPFASDSIAAGLGYNEQVGFMLEQIEVTIRTAISGSDGQTSVAYRELTKLYNEAREQLKGKLPQTQYDFLFKLETGVHDRSDYISRFAALGLVHPEIHALLDFQTDMAAAPATASSLAERIGLIFENILEWIVGKWTKTQAGQKADSKLDALATQLVLIEAKRRARLNVAKSATAAAIEETFRGLADKARDKVDDWVTSDFFKKSNSGYMRALGSVTSLAVNDRLDQLFLAYQTFSDTHFKNSQGTFAGILNELQGSNEHNVVFYKLLRMTKFLEGQRKDMITNTSKIVLESFVNKGKDLTDEMKKAISAALLRTDMSSLLEEFDLDGLQSLLESKTALAQAMAKTEAKLANNPHQLFYLNAAEGLGYQMAKGEAGMEHTLLNAYAAARLHGTEQLGAVTEADAVKVEPIIDTLASLYALSFISETDRLAAIKVFQQEQTRTDGGNGVEMVLRMHQKLQAESKARLFKEQEALMMKGYVPEIYDPYIEVVLADKKEAKHLKEQGYGEGMGLSKDLNDPETGDRVLFARHGSGLLPYLSGAISTKSNRTKGTTKHNGNVDLFSTQGQYNADLMTRINQQKRASVADMFTQRVHAGTTTESFMVPVINPSGKKVNYRYLMTNIVKDDVLKRDNRFDQLLGSMAGSIYDKQTAPKQNRTIVEALKAQYDLEFKTRAVSYVEIGPRSPDSELREKYRMLPEATKQAIREVWKSDSMFVRIDLLDINFGYRKKSLSDVFKDDPDAHEGLVKFLAEMLGFLAGGSLPINATDDDIRAREAKATVKLRTIEEVWQTFVREAKDMIVVKSGSTLMGNVISNFTLLYAYGVPVKDMMRSHRIAFRGAIAYKKDSDALFILQAKLDTGTSGNVEDDKAKVVQLKDALARNPVRHLIEAGLMPTIVEDVEVDDDIYSYKSKFVKGLNEKLDQVNPHILNVGKTIYMTHDTKLYKVMSQGAQLSDFLARYTLYQHMTTKKNPMGVEKAIQMASDAFINYDVPTHRNMQYANDMGMIRFTKYYLRIQKVLVYLYKDNPARMMGLMMMGNYFDAVPTVLDSSMFTRFGNNPLEWGALEYLTSFDDLATVKVVGAPF